MEKRSVRTFDQYSIRNHCTPTLDRNDGLVPLYNYSMRQMIVYQIQQEQRQRCKIRPTDEFKREITLELAI